MWELDEKTRHCLIMAGIERIGNVTRGIQSGCAACEWAGKTWEDPAPEIPDSDEPCVLCEANWKGRRHIAHAYNTEGIVVHIILCDVCYRQL